MVRFAATILLAVAALNCRRNAAVAEVIVEWKMTPTSPIVDRDALAEMTLADRSRQPVAGATVRIEAHMSHPGMAPMIQPVRESALGVYSAPMSFSMAGGWVVFVTGQLRDGRTFRQRLGDVIVRPAG